MTNVELIDKLNKSLVDDVQIDGEAIDILIDGYWDKIKNVPDHQIPIFAADHQFQ